MEQTISITVKGLVQGVFFRQSTSRQAEALGVRGTVQNKPDGSVFIVATGSAEQLDELKDWCKSGPARARVSSIEVKELPLQRFEDFKVKR